MINRILKNLELFSEWTSSIDIAEREMK